MKGEILKGSIIETLKHMGKKRKRRGPEMNYKVK